MKVGDRVLALGSPLALSQSVTMGIVSNTEMIMPGMFWPFNRMTLDGEDVGSIVRWIGHDAAIFGGNSGGPLVNMQGEIVGVNEISMGLAGAIPADLAREVANALIKDGRVKRGAPRLATREELEYFHTPAYVELVREQRDRDSWSPRFGSRGHWRASGPPRGRHRSRSMASVSVTASTPSSTASR